MATTKLPGAVPKKVYMHYEEGGDEAAHLTLKMTLPSKWASHTVDYLKDFFVEHYNGKKTPTLEAGSFHLEKKGDRVLFGDDLLHDAVQKYDDLYLKSGASTMKPEKKQAASTSAAANPNLLQCRNFGCTQKFEEAENSDAACRHHQAPPTFHDLKKGWQCCSTKMVYDWDEFERIEPCAVGRHSAVAPTAQFAQSPTVAAAEGAAAGAVAPAPAPVAAPVLKSIDDYNKTNPNAVTAVSAAVDTQKAPAAARTDGKARCVNYGCQKEYVVSENGDAACSHHSGPPVFHDAGKFWSCCPKDVKYDFDSFLQVPGCTKGPHRDTKA